MLSISTGRRPLSLLLQRIFNKILQEFKSLVYINRSPFGRRYCQSEPSSLRGARKIRTVMTVRHQAKKQLYYSLKNVSNYYFRKQLSREKSYNSALVIFFFFFSTRNRVRNIYKFIFVWIVNEMTFSAHFFPLGQQNSQIMGTGQTHALQKFILKPWLRSKISLVGLIATTRRQKYYVFLNNPASSC